MANQEVNIYEIAREAGVSIATVSRVINNSASVSDKRRKQVMDVIQRRNYIPSSAAKSLSTSRSNLVSVVIPDICDPFFMQVLQGITQESNDCCRHVFLFNTDENPQREAEVLRSLRQYSLRGIIISPVLEQNPQTLACLQDCVRRGVPVVLLDRLLEGGNFDQVISDDERGSFEAVSRLISLGHQRIAILKGPETSRPARERCLGYVRALRAAKLPLRAEYICFGDSHMECAYRQTLELLSLSQPPTAVYSSNNLSTYGCLKALKERKLEIGKDIALLGFDDVEPLNWLAYNISVVRRDAREMGRRAFQLLGNQLEPEDSTPECSISLPTELIFRGSEQAEGVTAE